MRFSTIQLMPGYKACETRYMQAIIQNALSLIIAPPSGGRRRRTPIDSEIFWQVWHVFQVWWVLGYVQAVKNVLIWDKKVVIRKTIGTSQVETCSGPNYWTEIIESQSKMETYVALNRQYTVAVYLTKVSDTKLRRTLTKYRLTELNLAVEVGLHRQTWLPRKERLCSYWDQGTVETELHFLTHCNQYESLRDKYFAKIKIFPDFLYLSEPERLLVLLERGRTAVDWQRDI